MDMRAHARMLCMHTALTLCQTLQYPLTPLSCRSSISTLKSSLKPSQTCQARKHNGGAGGGIYGGWLRMGGSLRRGRRAAAARRDFGLARSLLRSRSQRRGFAITRLAPPCVPHRRSAHAQANLEPKSAMPSQRASAEANRQLRAIGGVVKRAILATKQQVGRGEAATARHLLHPKPWRRLLAVRVVEHIPREL